LLDFVQEASGRLGQRGWAGSQPHDRHPPSRRLPAQVAPARYRWPKFAVYYFLRQ